MLNPVATMTGVPGDDVVVRRLRTWQWARRTVVACVVIFISALVWVNVGGTTTAYFAAAGLLLASIVAMGWSKRRAMRALPEAAQGWSWRVLHHRVTNASDLPVAQPWDVVDVPRSESLHGELSAEIAPGHPLYGTAFTVARECSICGELVVHRDDSTFAIVRPSGSSLPETLPLPRTVPLGQRTSAELAMLAHASDHPRASLRRRPLVSDH